MAYNKELDEVLFSESAEVGEFKLVVEVHSYKKNEPKLQITRMKGEGYLKLGRLNLEEVNAILPLIDKAKEKMVAVDTPAPPDTEEKGD